MKKILIGFLSAFSIVSCDHASLVDEYSNLSEKQRLERLNDLTLNDVGHITMREFCTNEEYYEYIGRATVNDYGEYHDVTRAIASGLTRIAMLCTSNGRTEISICDRIDELPRKQQKKMEELCEMTIAEGIIIPVEEAFEAMNK
ncbi:hypothetical protein EV694_1157 [Volucribacter psittacicida]|uniref:Lipoprotein n=1 Tax=Volucribacter psittacicida TaxID=203482 RepID=A0A4R1FV52_9PAST|nr:hypothetical protein [Volucribacter psittacicida]TCJ98733.1 hypothetical protein EV694_1157 [Volucribacter psittacicida]